MVTPGQSEPIDSLAHFHPVVRTWFVEKFREPSPPQRLGWPGIIRGEHTLLLAPTGSGKTLAAFLWTINHLLEQHINGDVRHGVQVLYVSPLKALNNDIHRNLEGPLEEILLRSQEAGFSLPPIRAAVRTGDTSQSERRRMLTNPPEILITTPESLYLMLTSRRAIPMFRAVQYVIIDEVHSLCGNKRGVHLSLSLERLDRIAEQEFVRIGLSATQRPLEEIARYLGGQIWEGNTCIPRPVTIVDAGRKKEMDLRVNSPVPDFSSLPRDTVWPSLLQHILELIRSHRNTLVFVNNRRLSERIAAELNDLLTETDGTLGMHHVPHASPSVRKQARDGVSAEQPVRAYHGSMSRESREQMETALKEGTLKALITTSALELGIDIGSIDLVIQIESPKGVARGLQRVGRSGHLITATSKGIVFPTHREDLVEAAVVGREMKHHRVEMTTIPRNCLDVLAQQIVAMVSMEEQDVDALFDFVRRSFCYQHLPRTLFDGVLRMLSGRYASDTLRDLRPRISWDKSNNLLRALPGSARLAVTGAGTIADRGYYGVYLEDGKTKVGEIDEEFVFESRSGDTFILGSDTWRISSIDPSRLTVTPAPGEPARMPFWRGERIGRTFELSVKVGEFRKELALRLQDENCLKWIRDEFPVDHNTAWQILEYARSQHQVAGAIPHNNLILIESFRDEIGDPRVIVHSSFGRRVNGMIGLFLVKAMQERTGSTPQMLYNDNGILLRSSDPDDLPTDLLETISFSAALNTI
ncbi:MAG: DEAD/DEAH box helicase, partial [Ignavibacteria bacterium]|nr:DEAD/DEAH box helicase [Ignavibacteria bacterium]